MLSETKPTPRKVYTPRSLPLHVLLGLANLAFSYLSLTSAATLLFAPVFFIAGSLLLVNALTRRLVITSDGISYYTLGVYAIHSTWENLARIERINLALTGAVRCLVLAEPGGKGWAGAVWMFPTELVGRAIPLGNTWANQKALEADLRANAPQIFTK
ncbi:MAG TPA: hypothetical protein VIO61_00525 [Anaerolineaceae bacterium]